MRRFGYLLTTLLQPQTMTGTIFIYNASQESFISISKSTDAKSDDTKNSQKLKQANKNVAISGLPGLTKVNNNFQLKFPMNFNYHKIFTISIR